MNLPNKIVNDAPLLEMRHVSLRLEGRPVLRDVELALLSGEIHVLLGANGSGKSSLAYLRQIFGALIVVMTAYKPVLIFSR